MEDFTFYDFEKRSTGDNRLAPNQVRLYGKTGNCVVYFNADISKQISERKLFFLRVAKNNLTGELYFVFNKTAGCEVKWTGKNIVVYNKDLLKYISKELALDAKLKNTINISCNLSNSKDFFTYKIIDIRKSWNI